MTDTIDHDQKPADEKPKRTGDHMFQKGVVPKVRRARGTQNKITRDLKQGIVHGAAKHGSDGKGKGGLYGYLEFCAKKYPTHYMPLLGKLLPYHINGNVNVGIGTLKIVSVPADRYLSPGDVARLVDPDYVDPPVVIENAPAMVREPEPDPPEVEVDLTNVTRLNPFDSR